MSSESTSTSASSSASASASNGVHKQLLFDFLLYLKSLQASSTPSAASTSNLIPADKVEDVDVICQLLSSTFDLNVENVDQFKELSSYPTSLGEIYDAGRQQLNVTSYQQRSDAVSIHPKFSAYVDAVAKKGYYDGCEKDSLEYCKRHAKVISKFQQKVGSGAQSNEASTKAATEKAAEEKKSAGNAAIAAKDYELAIRCYSEAIALCPDGTNSHIYYCNRAAAYCNLNDYKQAVSDCEISTVLCPTYAKAFSRLGLAHYHLEQFDKAIEAYKKAMELEPGNKAHADGLKLSQNRKTEKRAAVPSQPPAGFPGGMPGGGGMPDLSSLASMFGGGGGAGGAGGLAGLMNNPAIMQMAQQMMSNPTMMEQAQKMMQDPTAMESAMKMFGGGGANGMPDMSALASMLGGQQGQATPDAGVPQFSGFNNNPNDSANSPK